jgi:hypothetical protein
VADLLDTISLFAGGTEENNEISVLSLRLEPRIFRIRSRRMLFTTRDVQSPTKSYLNHFHHISSHDSD